MDAQPQALSSALEQLHGQWDKQLAKGKLNALKVTDWKSRLHTTTELTGLSNCDLVVEAIVENLEVKRQLMRDLDALLPADAVLASNTSSLSITAIAAGLPGETRLAGFHFFNPVPLMKVIEVVPGLNTHPDVVLRLCAQARAMGHTPVVTKDTPGFIVNHAGRGFVTEALQLVNEGVADFETTDTILKDQAGFKLGPFELMDLTGLDVSHPVMVAVHQQYFGEPRYKPSVITAQRLVGGVLGRKTGRGFYTYTDGQSPARTEPAAPVVDTLPPVWVSPKAARRAELYQLLKDLGARIETSANPSEQALILVAPLGLDVSTIAAVERLDAARTLGIDLMLPDTATRRRVLATNPAPRADMRDAAWA
jgi:3-hydroxybutyryl-CoA dehydrogenase